MKKSLLFMLVAIGLAACTSEEDIALNTPTEPISFSAVTKKASRYAFTDAFLPDGMPIYVTGYHHNTAGSFYSYFEDIKFAPTVGTASTASNKVYTPADNKPITLLKEGYLHFVAYFVENIDQPTVTWKTDDTNGVIKSGEFVFTNLDGKTDVCCSTVLRTEELSGTNPFSSRTLVFNHTLSWIMVNFNSATSTANNIKIRNVKIEDVYKNGTLNVTLADGSGNYYSKLTESELSWDTTGSPCESMEFPSFTSGDDGISFDNAAVVDPTGILVIPEAKTKIYFEYAVQNSNGNSETTNNNVNSEWTIKEIPLNSEEKWEPGKKYTYNIWISADQITFKCEVNGWESGGSESNDI